MASRPFLGLAVTVAVGVLLNQNAFQHGRLAAPLTALTLTDPIASVVIGITAFQETLTVTPGRVIGLVLAGATVAVGVWLAGTASERRCASLISGGGRWTRGPATRAGTGRGGAGDRPR